MLFQKSVLKSMVQDERLVASRWASFQDFLAKAEAIKSFKEEIYQDGFLHDVFENCLGYTLKTTNPSNYNLEREQKNETDGKKADGVIVINGEIIGIVELKDQKTKNLDAVESQAFNYHASHSNSKYIIISNFDELRFYIDKKTAYEKFNLFNLSYEDFKTLHLLISYESIRDNVPLKLKEKSTNFEQTISKELYRDFSQFRTHLFENIIKNNYESSEQIATSSEQLTDTLRHPAINTVIPAEAGIQSVDPRVKHEDDRLPDKQTLLRLTQKLCDRIIFILFAEDRGLLRANTIKEIREHFKNQAFTTYTLYDIYKFYFNAINEGNDKLGIPRYNGGLFTTDTLLDSLVIDDAYLDMEAQKLSDFDFVSDISVNILGHIFEQSLTDLEEINASINDTEFDRKKSKRKKDGVFYTPEYITRYIVENTLGKLCSDKKASLGLTHIEEPQNPKKLTKDEKETLAKLYEYRDWLLNLKILDPACGSGAFLNQALEFLIREHKNVDDYRRAYENEMLSLYDIETNILEHNLYGVDINEDAIEIAKLSLWLRTAQKGRMLTNLSDKIVCANSLLDMPFCRHSELDSESSHSVLDTESINQFIGCFDVVIGNPPYGAKLENDEQRYYEIKSKESAILFMQLSHKLLKENGLHSFIIPKPFIFSSTWEAIREKFKNEIFSIVDCSKVWEEVKLEQVIYSLEKQQTFDCYENLVLQKGDFMHIANIQKIICDEFGFFVNGVNQNEIDLALKIKKDKASLLDISLESNRGGMFQKEVKQSGAINILGGINIQRCEIRDTKGFIDKNIELTQNSYLRENSILVQEIIAHIQNPVDHIKITATILDDIQNYRIIDTIQQITLKNGFSNRYILSILHSQLINWYLYRFVFAKAIRTMHFSNQVIQRIPIPKISEIEQQPFIELVDEILSSKEKIKKYKKHFDILNAVDKIEITEEIEKLESRVAECENAIDQMVYKLYGMSEDEIGIVEGNCELAI